MCLGKFVERKFINFEMGSVLSIRECGCQDCVWIYQLQSGSFGKLDIALRMNSRMPWDRLGEPENSSYR